MGKGKWKLLELSLPRKTANQKQYYIPRGTAAVSAVTENLKDAGMVIPTMSAMNLII